MSSPPHNTRSSLPHPTTAPHSPVPHEQGGVPFVLTEDEEDIDQLAFTLDSPSHPQLEFFEKVFNTVAPILYCGALHKLSEGAGYLCGTSWITPMFKLLVKEDFRRFFELHGTPTQQASWTISVDLWRWYDALLHECTSSTTALMELNMLDDGGALDRDHQELSQFINTQ
ncbi:hypothetical protein EV368DRAFT_87644 [Lentinula lateritia]|nr:hypothetical protein EV368DRAFT_87644 [Lentinula lateritia]